MVGVGWWMTLPHPSPSPRLLLRACARAALPCTRRASARARAATPHAHRARARCLRAQTLCGSNAVRGPRLCCCALAHTHTCLFRVILPAALARCARVVASITHTHARLRCCTGSFACTPPHARVHHARAHAHTYLWAYKHFSLRASAPTPPSYLRVPCNTSARCAHHARTAVRAPPTGFCRLPLSRARCTHAAPRTHLHLPPPPGSPPLVACWLGLGFPFYLTHAVPHTLHLLPSTHHLPSTQRFVPTQVPLSLHLPRAFLFGLPFATPLPQCPLPSPSPTYHHL